MNLLIELIKYFSEFSGLPAVWLGRRIKGPLWYYVLASFLADVYWLVSIACPRLDNPRVHADIFYLAEFLLVGAYFTQQLFSKEWRKVVLAGLIGLTVWFIVHSSMKHTDKIDWEDISILNIILVSLCVGTLYKVIRNIKFAKLEYSPVFIFSAAFLLYDAYTVLLMLFAEHFRSAPKSLTNQLWAVHNVLNGLKNLSIAYVFIMQKRKLTA
jgi:hypothetical protein